MKNNTFHILACFFSCVILASIPWKNESLPPTKINIIYDETHRCDSNIPPSYAMFLAGAEFELIHDSDTTKILHHADSSGEDSMYTIQKEGKAITYIGGEVISERLIKPNLTYEQSLIEYKQSFMERINKRMDSIKLAGWNVGDYVILKNTHLSKYVMWGDPIGRIVQADSSYVRIELFNYY